MTYKMYIVEVSQGEAQPHTPRLNHIRLVGPFPTQDEAADWGRAHIEDPRWNTVYLLNEMVESPLQLLHPKDALKDTL